MNNLRSHTIKNDGSRTVNIKMTGSGVSDLITETSAKNICRWKTTQKQFLVFAVGVAHKDVSCFGHILPAWN